MSKAWLLVAVLVLTFAAVAGWLLYQRASAGRGMPDYSVHSSDPKGLAGTARLLTQVGYEPVALTRPVQHTRIRGLLIMVEPSYHGAAPEIKEQQAKSILNWVEHGNTLVLAGRHMNGLHRELDIDVVRDDRADAGDAARYDAVGDDPGGYTTGIEHIETEGRDRITPQRGQIVLWSGSEGPGAVVVPRGAGRVIIVADPSVLTARGLSRRDNVVFLYNVALLDAQDGRVYFDEYHHGLATEGGFWDYLRYRHETWAILPLGIFLGIGCWSVARRLGPAVPPVEEKQADAVAYASAVARVYQLAGVRRLLGRVLARDFLVSLCRYLRLRTGTMPALVLSAWQQRHGRKGSERLQSLLRGVSELRGPSLTERGLLEWTQAFDSFRNEVVSARRWRQFGSQPR